MCQRNFTMLTLHYSLVDSDPDKLSQLLFILIYDAMKYTNRGFIIVKVKFKHQPDQDLLRIKVQDTGIGMSDEQTRKLFTLFSNVKHKKQVNQHGIGLGLTKCHQIVTALGGKIYC